MIQQDALDILKTGASVFLTGEPGSGKTHTVNLYVAWLRERGIAPAITASTGIAATHIGGMTIHSWSGIGVRKELTQRDIHAIAANRRIAKRIEGAHVLIIDEVSMLAAETLSMIEAVCRHIRGKTVPFGGLQVVLVGDFFQLPPVTVNQVRNRQDYAAPAPSQRQPSESEHSTIAYAFRSPAWESIDPIICYLSEQYRQEDKLFLEILASIRSGEITDQIREALLSRQAKEYRSLENLPKLYSHNFDVDRVNAERLAAIPGKEIIFAMQYRGPESFVATLKRGCLSPETLTLKVGARVMFTKNSHSGAYVNGTIGEIEGFDEEDYPIVRTKGGRRVVAEPEEWSMADGPRTLARITQIPLRLAWALTIHKSQGMTLEEAVMDLSGVFEYGQGYVALSRVKSLAGLHLLGLNDHALQVDPAIIVKDADFKQCAEKARVRHRAMSEDERQRRAQDFIHACGGSMQGKRIRTDMRKKPPRGATLEVTLALFANKHSVAQIAQERGLAISTIFSHLSNLYMAGRIEQKDLERMVSPILQRALPVIHAAFGELGAERLAPIHEKFGGRYSYEDLRLARLLMK
ncbi:MAG: helix-turn-helix domain-containing protein [bacterium]|nr:helix-turn-helix domain-containing protein [bacterium]